MTQVINCEDDQDTIVIEVCMYVCVCVCVCACACVCVCCMHVCGTYVLVQLNQCI